MKTCSRSCFILCFYSHCVAFYCYQHFLFLFETNLKDCCWTRPCFQLIYGETRQLNRDKLNLTLNLQMRRAINMWWSLQTSGRRQAVNQTPKYLFLGENWVFVLRFSFIFYRKAQYYMKLITRKYKMYYFKLI